MKLSCIWKARGYSVQLGTAALAFHSTAHCVHQSAGFLVDSEQEADRLLCAFSGVQQ